MQSSNTGIDTSHLNTNTDDSYIADYRDVLNGDWASYCPEEVVVFPPRLVYSTGRRW